MLGENKSIYILNLEAKDLYLSNNYITPSEKGYHIYNKNGDIDLHKFSGTYDNSLDLEKLKKVYYSIYRRRNVVFNKNGNRYTKSVINLNFTYSVKEFNSSVYYPTDPEEYKKLIIPRVSARVYTKVGYNPKDLVFKDNICIIDGELVGVIINMKTESPVSEEILQGRFAFSNGTYQPKNLKTLVTTRELRDWIYKNGFLCDGIKYIRFKRSNGSSRLGKCLFIDEKLYRQFDRWQRCGIKPEKCKDFDLAAYEAYIGLTLSSIIDTVEIYPENILVIDDYESTFSEKMIVTREVDGWLQSKVEEATVHNKIWDGQSLMDTSLFGKYSQYGMLLLRNRFFKSCCFNTNIQQWFKDNNITEVSQLNGFTLAENIEDIKLITTPSSIKYLKFGTLKEWLKRIEPIFGIVKHEKPTHNLGGKLVSTHYQLINTLEMTEEEVEELLQPTISFLNLLNENPAALRHHIKYNFQDNLNRNIKTKNDIIYMLLGLTDKFARTKLYEDFKIDLLKSIKSDTRKGRLLVNGNYSVLFGNPIEMLQFSINKFDGQSQIGVGNIYSKNFPFNITILGSRSPHVCASNIYLAKNIYNAAIEKYFNLSKQIVVVNSINESLLDRFSGSDFDSDTCMLTDNEILIKAASKNYDKFLVPLNAVQAKKVYRDYCWQEVADLDAKTSNNKIGEDINLAQCLMTKFWDNIHSGQNFEENMDLYCDVVSLDILSNIEIDKAKKEFTIDTKAEIDKIRKKYCIKTEDEKTVLPKFLGYIAKDKGYYDNEHKAYIYHKSSMDFVEKIMSKVKFKKAKQYINISDLLDPDGVGKVNTNYKQRKQILKLIDDMSSEIFQIGLAKSLVYSTKRKLIEDIKDEGCRFVNSLQMNINTIRMLISTIENPKYKKYRTKLFYMLFNPKNDCFYNALEKSRTPLSEIVQDDNGYISIYGYKYKDVS